jgi:Na+-driven multidrug efflux pump
LTADTALIQVSDAPRVSLPSMMGRIIVLAAPLAISACILSGLNLGMLTILARHGDTEAIYLMSLMQPAFFIIIAMMEGLAITNQVFSARCKNEPSAGAVLKSSRALSLVGLLLIGAIALIAYCVSQMLLLPSQSLALILSYLPIAALSMAAFLVFEIHHSALRGSGHALLAIGPFALAAILSLLVTYVLLDRYQIGFTAVLIGNFAGPLIMLPIVLALVRRIARKDEEMTQGMPEARRIWPLLSTVGFPVFFSILIASASAAFVFPIIDRFGEDEVSAFLVVLRLRVAFTIPAVAAGSAIAILVNQSPNNQTGLSGDRYLAAGIPLVFTVYAVATIVILLAKTTAIGLIVPENASTLNLWSNNLLWLLLPTFFLMPCVVCIQIILEQIGDGPKVLVFTIVAEIATISAIIFSTENSKSIETISHVLTVSSALLFAAYIARLVYVLHHWEKNHAI